LLLIKAWCPICCKTCVLHFEIIKTKHLFYSYSINYTFHIQKKKHFDTFRKRKVNSTSHYALTFSAPKYCLTAQYPKFDFMHRYSTCINMKWEHNRVISFFYCTYVILFLFILYNYFVNLKKFQHISSSGACGRVESWYSRDLWFNSVVLQF
jgi:hypothetical protein